MSENSHASSDAATSARALWRLPVVSFVLAVLAIVGAAGTFSGCIDDDDDDDQSSNIASGLISLRSWNSIAVDASGLDHAPSNVGPPHTQGEQLGPCRSSRAMAIVHIAMYDAVMSILKTHQRFTNVADAPTTASLTAAIAQAARDTLVALFPSQTAIFNAELTTALAGVQNGGAKTAGITAGQAAAAAILALRANDGSNHPEPVYGVDYIATNAPGEWRQDPVSQIGIALGAQWSTVAPFVMTSASQFLLPPPPALTSPEYAAAYNEAKALGGDGITTVNVRSADDTETGIFWAYDGTPSLCAPPRLYNQIARLIANQQQTGLADYARLLALVNTSMADAGIAAWHSKYFYKFWRPVTGIRESDPGTGPTGLGDGNAATIGDTNYMPLGAPASNGTGPNFTPPFPAYPSGHATFGGALFQTLRRFYGTDDIQFTFVSDEFNGITVDNQGNVRPLVSRTFDSFSEAEEENGQSRIYLGIHWSFDKTSGISQGNNVGNNTFDNAFRPVP